jgi:hypothetical protein
LLEGRSGRGSGVDLPTADGNVGPEHLSYLNYYLLEIVVEPRSQVCSTNIWLHMMRSMPRGSHGGIGVPGIQCLLVYSTEQKAVLLGILFGNSEQRCSLAGIVLH